MTTSSVVVMAFAIGLIAGLRSMTAPALVSWAAHLKWIELQNSPLSFLSSTAAAYILTLGAIGELIVDKFPSAPNRTDAFGLIARAVTGAVSGAALCTTANRSLALGAILGAAGGIIGGFAGYQIRTRLVRALEAPLVVALLEDAVAIGGGLFLVTRF